ncbi:unnamed protein product, partial [Effrenium voratum]
VCLCVCLCLFGWLFLFGCLFVCLFSGGGHKHAHLADAHQSGDGGQSQGASGLRGRVEGPGLCVRLASRQAESPGRVLVITEDLQLRHFGSFTENSFPGVIMLGELNKLLLQDSSSRVLSEVAARGGNQPQGAMLSAAVLVRVVQNRRKGTAPDRRTDFPELRQEM